MTPDPTRAAHNSRPREHRRPELVRLHSPLQEVGYGGSDSLASFSEFGAQSLLEAKPRILYAANVATFFRKFLLDYARHFRAKGWRVDALSKGLAGEPLYQQHFDRVWEVEWARKPHKLRGVGSIMGQIRRIVEHGDYDLIHVHTPVAALVTRFALRKDRFRGGAKIIYTAHGFHFFQGASKTSGRAFEAFEKAAGRWTDYLIVMNEEDHRAARRMQMVPEDRIVYMPGIGIDLSHYRRSDTAEEALERQKTRQELDVSDSDKLFLCIAEFIPRKRQADVLHALARISDPSVKVAFAGVGETLEKVRRQAASLGLRERTRFLGMREDVPRLIRASDCTVLPSSQEGLPRSVMESMGIGVPVIGTDIRGTRDLLGAGGGILYPVGEIALLAKAIAEVAGNPRGASEIGERGRQSIGRYDFENVVRMHEAVYAHALGQSSDAAEDRLRAVFEAER